MPVKMTVSSWKCLAVCSVLPAAFLLCPEVAFAQDAGTSTPADRVQPARAVAEEEGAAAPARFPVEVDGRTLFYVAAPLKMFTPQQRAEGITERIVGLAKDPLFRVESITSSDDSQTSDIFAGDKIVMVVSDADAYADGRGLNRLKVAEDYALKIKAGIERYRQDRTTRNIVLHLAYAAADTLILILVLYLYVLVARKVRRITADSIKTRAGPLLHKTFGVDQLERMLSLADGMFRLAGLLFILLVFYVYIQFMLGFFPATRSFANQLLDLVLVPLKVLGTGVLAQIPNLFFVSIEHGTITFSNFFPEWAKPTFKLVRLLVIAFAAVVAFPYIPGSDSPAFKGVSIFLGVLFSLNSSTTIANMVAGLTNTYRRALKVGDWVKIGDTVGCVTEMRLLVTHLRSFKNEEIVVPNTTIQSTNIVNYSTEAKKGGLILYSSVTIGYGSPWRTVHKLLIDAALATTDVKKTPEPFVLQKALNDFYVTYEINACTDKPEAMPRIYSDLHQNIQDRFNEAGVEIMSPHYAQLRDGNEVTIPKQYLPDGYEPPGIRLVDVDKKKA
jgi:small-conductance mechanosensitive channel